MKRGFTLIELLIVIAIIAILALIAIPNFLESQVRAKVARAQADERSIGNAVEAYFIDYCKYPMGYTNVRQANVADSSFMPVSKASERCLYSMSLLTTPIAYLSSIPLNPFFDFKIGSGRGNYSYWGNDPTMDKEYDVAFQITSCGPDGISTLAPVAYDVIHRTPYFLDNLYDPTNGTRSNGDLHCSNKGISY